MGENLTLVISAEYPLTLLENATNGKPSLADPRKFSLIDLRNSNLPDPWMPCLQDPRKSRLQVL